MRGHLTTLAIGATLMAAPALAAPDETASDSAMAAAVSFMASFNTKDAEGMSALALDGATVTVIEERDGADRVQTVPLAGLIASIAASPSDIEEPIFNLDVMQEGPVATVIANFEFLVDGERSHCGTNLFNLVRVESEWKVASITYSHIEEGCLAAIAK